MHSKLKSVEAGLSGNYSLKAKNNKLPVMKKSGKFTEREEEGGRGKLICFNSLQNSSKDAGRDHRVFACAAFEISVMCARQFPPSKVPEDDFEEEE